MKHYGTMLLDVIGCYWMLLDVIGIKQCMPSPDECNAEDYFAPELIASKGSMGTSCDAHVLSLHFCADVNHLLNDCQNMPELSSPPITTSSRANKSLFLAEYPFLCFLETFEVFSLMSFDVI